MTYTGPNDKPLNDIYLPFLPSDTTYPRLRSREWSDKALLVYLFKHHPTNLVQATSRAGSLESHPPGATNATPGQMAGKCAHGENYSETIPKWVYLIQGNFQGLCAYPYTNFAAGRGLNYKIVSSCLARSSLKSGVWGWGRVVRSNSLETTHVPPHTVPSMSVQIQPL